MTMYRQDPDEVLDYQFDWTSRLDVAETITTFTVTAQSGLTIEASPAPAQVAGVVTYWVSGGTVGTIYGVTCHIVTSTGREWDHTDQFRITEH